MKSRFLSLCIIMRLLSLTTVHAVTVGSDTAVTRLYSQVTLNNGDIVTGFTELQGGLMLTDTSVTATWNALFPLSGNVVLNGGLLYLQRDFLTTDTVSFNLPGNIAGNGYNLNLAPSTTMLSGCMPDLMLTQTIGLLPSIGCVGWSYDDQYVVAVGGSIGGSGFAIQNYRYSGTSLILVGQITAATAGVGMQAAAAWMPAAYYFASGAGATNGFVTVYNVDNTGAVTKISADSRGTGAINALAWQSTGLYLASATTIPSNTLVLYPVTATGVLGTPIVQNRPNNAMACDWMVTGTYLAVGFVAAATNEFEIYTLGGTPAAPTLTLSLGFPNGVNAAVNIIKWNPVYQNIFAAGLANTGAGDNVQIWQYDPVANTAIKLTSISGLAVGITAVDWSNDGSCLLVGLGNITAGAPMLQVYYYDAIHATLSLNANISFTNVTSTTSTGARYSPVNNYIAQSARPSATSAQLRISILENNVSTFSNLTMVLNGSLNLNNGFITFSVNSMIQGNDNVLSLASTATLAVAPNSTLTLKNITMRGITANSIQMLGSTSNLILSDANLILDGTYSFTQGSLTIHKDVTVSGFNRTFLFSSSLPCIVRSKSQLFLDELVTWSHVPPTNANNLLQFTDSSSYLYLNGASLVTTRTGLNLTKGTLVVDRHSYIASSAQVAAEAVTLGDGVSTANDMTVQIYPAATLDVSQGILVNNNV